jgi:hypothetical protein
MALPAKQTEALPTDPLPGGAGQMAAHGAGRRRRPAGGDGAAPAPRRVLEIHPAPIA